METLHQININGYRMFTMKKLIVAGAVFFPLFFSGSAWSSCEENVCQGHAEVITPAIKANAREVMVRVQPEAGANLWCQLYEGEYALLDDKAKQFDLHRSLFITAIASQSDIRVEFDPQSSVCTVSSVELIVP
ncbi:hypothetical protein CWE15_11775 [Aliidiomarina taiwanensis]|uniref:Uncharacterized protein n=2 Tax=Aliidiomarina taiwanensis TaxID=946228 RepID=A0A432WTG1_9GAMM|nr:hypothetical protein CWE15_11775 [Aliidiomarina taiwanensis]